MICKNCGKEFESSTKKYCCSSCAHAAGGKASAGKRKTIKIKRCDSKQGGWDCCFCKQNFRTRRELQEHKKQDHLNDKQRFGNHFNICYCVFCGRKFTSKEGNTVHERFCKNNPKRDVKRSQELSEIQKKAQTKPDVKKKHSEAIYKRYMNADLESFYFSKNKIKYKEFLLDSLWEKKFLERCDELQIKYEKCESPFIWIDTDGISRKYYPDFYLPDFNKIIEIKSPFVEKCQNKNGKIDYIKSHYPDIIWLSSLEEITSFSL